MKNKIMNTVNIVDGNSETTLDDNVKISSANAMTDIFQIKIDVLKDTDLKIVYQSTNKLKLDIVVQIPKDVKCNIYELKQEGKYKISTSYFLNENSLVNIYKLHDADKVSEMTVVNLDGENAQINYLLKTISTDKEKYDIMVYHNAKNTVSHIINNGVNIKDGHLKLSISSFVPKNNIDCVLDQNSRIINLTNHKCEIRPNLFIDENDVVASHSAHIGKCNDEELFYLMSRGITKKEAENLIIQGFLLNGLEEDKEQMEKIISKYWR